MQLKPLLRLLAIDDGHFKPHTRGRVLLVGVLSRLDNRIEGVLSSSVQIDGTDATKAIEKMLCSSRFKEQAAFLLLSGVNFAGFNMVDAMALNKRLGIPVLIVFRKRPEIGAFKAALKKFSDANMRLKMLENAGKIFSAEKFFFQAVGMKKSQARQLVKKLCRHSNLPEPLRLAHIVASGISLGESTRP
jgi:endonuclease V-like protein UPF0215 family